MHDSKTKDLCSNKFFNKISDDKFCDTLSLWYEIELSFYYIIDWFNICGNFDTLRSDPGFRISSSIKPSLRVLS